VSHLQKPYCQIGLLVSPYGSQATKEIGAQLAKIMINDGKTLIWYIRIFFTNNLAFFQLFLKKERFSLNKRE